VLLVEGVERVEQRHRQKAPRRRDDQRLRSQTPLPGPTMVLSVRLFPKAFDCDRVD
jgi:hypothetical protein